MSTESRLYPTDKQVAARYGIGRSTLWAWVKAGTFPNPLKLAEHTTRWRIDDVERFENERQGA